MGKVVTICDHLFLEHTQSASIGGGNIGVGPTHFEWKYADAQTARFVTDSDIKHARGKGQVAWLLEPFELHPENYYSATYMDFDAVLMHSHHRTFGAKWYPYGGSWISFDEWGMKKKTKNISMIISDKDTMPGHLLRNKIARNLVDMIDIFIDFPDKMDALAPYKYSIVIESTKYPDYFSEKLIDCMCVGTVPIYWGAPAVITLFNPNGIISMDTYEGIEDMVNLISKTNGIGYEKRMPAIDENIKRCKDLAICEDVIYAMYPELFE